MIRASHVGRQTELLLKKIAALQSEIALLKPKAEYCDQVLLATNTITTTEIGELFGLSASRINKELKKLGIIYKKDKRWFLTLAYQNKDLACSATHSVKKDTNEGSYRAYSHLRWTQKGKFFVYKRLIEAGYTPIH